MHNQPSPDKTTQEREQEAEQSVKVLETFPVSHEQAYIVQASRNEGERELAEIASHHDREYLWTYDNTTQTWRHYPANHTASVEREGRQVVSAHLLMEVPSKVMVPPSRDSSFYHTHPSSTAEHMPKGIATESAPVQSQLPSTEDIEVCVKMALEGYVDFKIVTPVGVTTVAFDAEGFRALGAKKIHLPEYNISVEQLARWVSGEGVIRAAQKAVAELNAHYDGQLKVSFKTLSEIA